MKLTDPDQQALARHCSTEAWYTCITKGVDFHVPEGQNRTVDYFCDFFSFFSFFNVDLFTFLICYMHMLVLIEKVVTLHQLVTSL